MTESTEEILRMVKRALFLCKTKTDPLKQEQLFSCIDVALSQVERGLYLCQLIREHELVQSYRNYNSITVDRKTISTGEKEE